MSPSAWLHIQTSNGDKWDVYQPNCSFGRKSRHSLRDAFSQSHNAVQWLARIERSFRSGNSGADVALQWNEERKAFVTDEFFDGLRMELKLPELTLQFLEDGKPVKHALHMEGRSPAQVEAWVLVELLHRGVDRDRFSKDLPYEIPHAMVGDGVEYSPEFREVELKQVLEWFSAAAELMKKLAKQPDNKVDSPSELVLRSRDFSLEVSVRCSVRPMPRIMTGRFASAFSRCGGELLIPTIWWPVRSHQKRLPTFSKSSRYRA